MAKVNLKSLDAYKIPSRKLSDGVEVTLKRGLKAVLKPRPNPDFDGAMLEAVTSENKPEGFDPTARAMADHVVVSIDDIADSNAIYEVLTDPQYYLLKSELYQASGNMANFIAGRAKEAKKD